MQADAVLEGPSDAELISSVRAGDTEAYGQLFARHIDAARRLARSLLPGADADDLVSEAFAKVLVVLQRGDGPDLALRPYLLTAVRRLHIDKIRSDKRLQPTDDFEPYDPGTPFRDTAVEGFENVTAAKAFGSLPERWQMVLWHTEVEGMSPQEIAPLLGMSPNSVAALAYRAREGLRQAFISCHAQDADDEACEWTQDNLGAYIRSGTSRRDSVKVETHLEDCRRCMAIYLELTEVNANLRGILAPLVLGGAAAAYLEGGVLVGTASGGIGGAITWLQNFVRQPAGVAAGATVAVAAVAGAVAMVAGGGDDPRPAESADVAPPAPPPPPAPGGGGGGGGGGPAGGAGDPAPAVAAPVPTPAPESTPTPTASPTENPTEAPKPTPSASASQEPSPTPTVSASATPTASASPTATASATPTPTPTLTPAPFDLTVSAGPADEVLLEHPPLAWQFPVHVSLVSGTFTGPGTVTISSTKSFVALPLPPTGCSLISLDNTMTCTVDSVPASFLLTVGGSPNQSFDITVSAPNESPTTNNHAEVELPNPGQGGGNQASARGQLAALTWLHAVAPGEIAITP